MMEGKREREKGRKGGDARRRYSQRRPRLVGHAHATFARCARRKEGGGIASARIADRRSRVVDRPPGGAEWDGDEVKEGTDIKKGWADSWSRATEQRRLRERVRVLGLNEFRRRQSFEQKHLSA
jgi:hypothetical protein